MAKKKIQLTQLGRYKITGELGRGAMGVVYKGEDPALDRTVALKTVMLSDDAAGKTEYQKRFFLEAKAAGRLSHPQIITVYDFGQEGDVAYMAMEFLKGKELRTRMQEGSISVPEAVHIAQQVAEGLGYAHEHGVVHRDIKPSNIMLLPNEQVKIMDFGIARMRASDHKTSTGLVLGTPKYMSPEQVSGSPVDHRSDIFSVGVVLYEMLTQSKLFQGEDTPQIFHAVANFQPPMPSRLNSEVPPMLDFVVERALKKDPAVRYQDAFELASDLRSALSELVDREAAAAGEKQRDRDTTKTMKLDAEALKAVLPMPTAAAIGSDTRLPVSVRFDCSDAIERLTAPTRADRALLRRAPRPVGLLRRLIRHRMLVATMIAAALVGGAIALA
ncbi:MAG TPA: serine/threonine-protein kinase [Burkholderiales bacterium]|jgi:serine/threonine protein kinase|nr:serine/threonine-protein kinase [Burkholderiales bacterium]